jgi:hypothetical protein
LLVAGGDRRGSFRNIKDDTIQSYLDTVEEITKDSRISLCGVG